MSLLKAEHLSVKEGSKEIVKDVNWEINSGENWVLFGLNGCGKTTLLSRLAGYLSPSGGKVFLFGEEVTPENQLRLRKKIGWVSSSFFVRYLRYETVLEIVLAGKYGTLGFQDQWIGKEDVHKAKKILADFGLKERMRYPYDMLSKGQQQKVLIARALMADPELMILDEPCGGLDIFAREYFLHMVEGLTKERNMGVIYVTHHTEEILPFFNKAALMKDGALTATGDLKKVFTKTCLSDFFEVPTDVLWTKNHFFINLNLNFEQKSFFSIA